MTLSVSLAVEGPLDEQVLRRALAQVAPGHLQPGTCYIQPGRDRLQLQQWDARRASAQSPSLERAIRALQRFRPTPDF